MMCSDGGSLGPQTRKRNRLCAASTAVGDHQRPILKAGNGGCERDFDLAAAPCRNTTTAIIGLAKLATCIIESMLRAPPALSVTVCEKLVLPIACGPKVRLEEERVTSGGVPAGALSVIEAFGLFGTKGWLTRGKGLDRAITDALSRIVNTQARREGFIRSLSMSPK